MVDRVLMGPSRGTFGLFISKPGFDVHTCADVDLSFDSRLGHYGSIIVSGTATYGQTVYFPDMSYVPMGYAYCTTGNVFRGHVSLIRTDNTGIPDRTPGKVSDNWGTLIGGYKIYKNRIVFLGDNYPALPGQNRGAITIRYVVWRAPGGL